MTLLAVAMTGVIMLITDFVFGTVTTTITAAVVALTFAWLWYAMPLRRLRHLDRD
jgi:hypothetical protein